MQLDIYSNGKKYQVATSDATTGVKKSNYIIIIIIIIIITERD